MWTRRIVSMVLANVMLVPTMASAQTITRRAPPVGRTVRRIVPVGPYEWRGAITKALITSVWYPAFPGTLTSEHTVGLPATPLFQLGRWAGDAKRADAQFPIILLSHGTGGSAEIMAWLGAGLASRGYVVAAVNHPGNNALEPYTPEGFLLWWERARDLSTVLNFLLRDQQLAPMIDRQRIGAIGFSLGGYTTIVLAGGRTDPARFRKYCESPGAEGCADPPEFPKLFDRWRELESTNSEFRAAVRRAGSSHRDPRIRSVFAIAPAGGPAMIPESLRGITIPVEIVAGEEDHIAPVASNAGLLAAAIPGAQLRVLQKVAHYTFLATCTDTGRQGQPQLCGDVTGLDRESIHQGTLDDAAEFFRRTLR
jgi:predicted dienelactone hydrolase